MLFSLSFVTAALISSSVAHPLSTIEMSQQWSKGQGWPTADKNALKPTRYTGGMSDIDILHYALTLEHVQDAFYRQGLANYSQYEFQNAGFPDPFYDDLKQMSAEESEHVQFLSDTLTARGAPVSAECTYNFPSTDATGFVILANIIEGLGTSAYLGAARNITNGDILTGASSIMTDEARHSSYFRKLVRTSPFPSPHDVPLTPDEVYTIAHVFLDSCPASNPVFPIKAFPALQVALNAPGAVTAGSTVTLSTPRGPINGTTPTGAFITVKGPVYFPLMAGPGGTYTATIPRGVVGQSYLLLNKGSSGVSDDSVLAGPTWLEISS